MDLAHAGHQVGGVSWSVVERLAVHRMAGRGTAGLASDADAVGLTGSSPERPKKSEQKTPAAAMIAAQPHWALRHEKGLRSRQGLILLAGHTRRIVIGQTRRTNGRVGECVIIVTERANYCETLQRRATRGNVARSTLNIWPAGTSH